ncbi:hypothetical protein [Thermomonospora cellulosilytica]|uniref:Uncharacterized protein n=1 Tax=Thermomonospora cellulosilytica TaxID=1411118 RepID=A0A7W3MWT7_9ACTN|nr:hypothetical protein [Thermomonospora cellulosilytica]MBA9003262.1 hypothetical protein [Thermomonospora cellulosilytica]
MRPDGDPEHDDYGLPRIDVVIPDDARELERDLIAYRREERRKRRRERMRRLLGPLGRFGVAVPLIAGALIIALVSGTLLTVLGPRPTPRTSADPVAGRPSAAPGRVGGVLPSGRVTVVTGATPYELPVLDLRSGVIGIVPPGCDCGALVAELGRATRANMVNFWLVADRRRATVPEQESIKELRALAGESHDGVPGLVSDPRHVLASAYDPDPSDARLTAVLVHTDGVVADVLHGPVPGPALTQRVSALKTASTRVPR